MATPIKIKVLAAVLLLATPISASAGGATKGPGWGAVAGAGILGGIIGAASAPQPQPQQPVIVIIQPAAPAPPAPAPPAVAPQPDRVWWCASSRQWFPAIQTCRSGWVHPTPVSSPPPTQTFEPHYWWCLASRQWYPDVQTCSGPW